MIAGVLEIQLMANMSRLSDDMRRTERVVGDSMTKVERSVASASRALSSLGLGVSIGLIADQMRRTADSFTKLDAQIRLSTKSQQQYNRALGDIRRISTIAQSDISATTMLYTRLLNTTEGMGISQAKLATVTETVSYGLKAYGATSAEAASAALQLSQAMGANRLGGEEFRAVMEAMPNVMKVLAKSMGVPLGELRALSIAGKITTAEMVKAFGDPAVAAEFKKMAERAQTITGAWTVARNELTLLFGEFAKSSGLTQGMISAFNGLAGALRVVAQYIGEITMLLGAWVALRVTQMIYGYVAALIAQRAAALAAAQAELARVNMTYGASAATVAAARSSYAYAAANTTLGGSLMILGQRMTAFVSANAAAIAITALAVAVVALKRDFDDVIDSVSKFQAKIRGMDVEALRAARQLEVANVAAMKSSIFSGFNERDILFAERRIRMMDAQIIAAEKLAKAEGLGGGKAAKPVKDRTTIFERMTVDMQSVMDAELYGRLTNVDKVKAAWDKLNDQQKRDAKYLSDYRTALVTAEIADETAKRQAIAVGVADSILKAARSGNIGKSLLADLQATFETKVIKVQIEAVVNNIMAGGIGSKLGTFGLMLGGAALVAAALPAIKRGLFGGDTVMGELRTVGTATRAGFSGGMEQSWSRSGGLLRSGASGVIRTALATAQQKAIDATIKSLQTTFSNLGSAIGDLGVRTRAYSVSINQAGDISSALADGIGLSLVPALEEFRIAGENLADTAKRITTVFTETTALSLSLGVNTKDAFGALGIASGTARMNLIDAAGGIEAFSRLASSFMQNFLTDAQRLQPALDAVGRVFYELGIQGVTTKKQFADLVASELKLGHYDVVGRLLGVADAFNAIVTSAEQTQTALKNLLKTSSFENIVSYQRAMRAASTPDISGQISSSVATAKDLSPAEKEANRAANKASALAQLNEAIKQRDSAIAAAAELVSKLPNFARAGIFEQLTNPFKEKVARLQAIYDSIPAFATGGDHMGGLRLVGENGPELEATGPSRIYTASQTASMLSDGMGGDSVADEVRMLRREAAAHAIALNTATQKLAKIADRWDLQGLPPERIAA